MVEPVTTGLLLGGLATVVWNGAQAAMAGVVGNEAHQRLRDVIRARVVAKRSLDRNHDIARALRRAQLAATEYVVLRYERTIQENPPRLFLGHVKTALEIARNDASDLSWNEALEQEAFEVFDRAFVSPGAVDGRAAAEMAWAEVLGWASVEEGPSALEERFFGRVQGPTSWYEAFRSCIVEELKTEQRFRDVFFAERLVEMGDIVVEGQAVWRRLEGETLELRLDIADLRLAVGRIEAATQRIEAGQEEIKAMLFRSDVAQAVDRAGMTAAQIVSVVRDLAAGGLAFDDAATRLSMAPEELREIQTSLLRVANSDPRVAALKAQASEALDAGRFAEAKALLVQAVELDTGVAREAEEVWKERQRGAAESLAILGRIARLEARPLEAAARFGGAAERVAAIDPETAWRYRFSQADAFEDEAQLFPGLASLQSAITIWRDRCIPHTPRDTRPADWAMTQNRLGIALQTLGARTGGAAGLAALNEAVDAYRAALEVLNRKDMPADWAMTQSNLGNALKTLGERAGGEAGLAALNEGVAAFRAALEVRTRKDMPVQWARTIANLALAELAAHEIKPRRRRLRATLKSLEEAVSLFEDDGEGGFGAWLRGVRSDLRAALG